MTDAGPGAAGGARRARAPRPQKHATLVGREDLSPTLAVFRFEPDEGVPDFDPGQFVTLGVAPDSDTAMWRPYSIASPPEEKRFVELYVRLVSEPRGKRHFTPLLFALRPLDRVLYKGPRGRFAVAEQHPDGSPDTRRLLLVAGGTGLAPFLSMTLHRRSAGSARPIVLCHGARGVGELGYRRLLLDLEEESRAPGSGWSLRYLATVSRPQEEGNAGWTGPVGRVETLLRRPAEDALSPVEAALGEALDPRTTCAYVCGFAGTVEAAVGALRPLGFRTHEDPRPDGSYDVRYESYG